MQCPMHSQCPMHCECDMLDYPHCFRFQRNRSGFLFARVYQHVLSWWHVNVLSMQSIVCLQCLMHCKRPDHVLSMISCICNVLCIASTCDHASSMIACIRNVLRIANTWTMLKCKGAASPLPVFFAYAMSYALHMHMLKWLSCDALRLVM